MLNAVILSILFTAQTPIGKAYQSRLGPARFADSADDVHKMILNNYPNAENSDFWRWQVAGHG